MSARPGCLQPENPLQADAENDPYRPDRFFVVDGLGEPEEIEILIWNEIHTRFFNED